MSFIDAANQIIGDIAAPYALIQQVGRAVGTIIFDVTVREVHNDTDTITVWPVETGTPISDHVFANPKMIEISAGSSDATGGFPGYCREVYEGLLALKATREPFDVSTGKRFYSNMLFGDITVVTDETSEYALLVTARLQEVIISSTSSGGDGNGLSQDNQAEPQQTAPESQFGTQQIQNVTGAAPLSFDQYMSGF